MRTRAGTLLPGLALAILVAPAFADTVASWEGYAGLTGVPSTATIQPTTEPGAVAEIVFRNEPWNQASDNNIKTVTLGGLTFAIEFHWQTGGAAVDGADAITVYAPDGYIAIPDRLVVPESHSGVVLIYPETAVGM